MVAENCQWGPGIEGRKIKALAVRFPWDGSDKKETGIDRGSKINGSVDSIYGRGSQLEILTPGELEDFPGNASFAQHGKGTFPSIEPFHISAKHPFGKVEVAFTRYRFNSP